jgi:hypothetical protein
MDEDERFLLLDLNVEVLFFDLEFTLEVSLNPRDYCSDDILPDTAFVNPTPIANHEIAPFHSVDIVRRYAHQSQKV